MYLGNYFIDKGGLPYKGTGKGIGAAMSAGLDLPAETKVKGKDQYGAYADAPTGGPSGTGLGFLSSMTIGGRSLDDPMWAADPFRGGKKRFAGIAALAGRFLKGEMGPGGYLSDAAQSYETAAQVGAAVGGITQQRLSTESALAAGGLGRAYASRIAGIEENESLTRVRQYNAALVGEVRGMRFDAMKGFIDMVNQTAIAEKGRVAQIDMAHDANRSANRAATISGISAIVGAGVGGYLGK